MAKGAAVGAAIGAAISAATGQNIVQGIITGAISGAIFGGIGELGLKGAAHTLAHTMGGAASGAASGAITGDNIGMNALIGGISAGTSEYLGRVGPLRNVSGKGIGIFVNNLIRRAFIGSVMGGTISAATGGSFGYGAKQGGMTSAIAYTCNEAMHAVEEGVKQAKDALSVNQGQQQSQAIVKEAKSRLLKEFIALMKDVIMQIPLAKLVGIIPDRPGQFPKGIPSIPGSPKAPTGFINEASGFNDVIQELKDMRDFNNYQVDSTVEVYGAELTLSDSNTTVVIHADKLIIHH